MHGMKVVGNVVEVSCERRRLVKKDFGQMIAHRKGRELKIGGCVASKSSVVGLGCLVSVCIPGGCFLT